MTNSKITQLLIASFLTLITTSVVAQSKVVRGHIVTQQGDKIEGEFINLDWQQNPESIVFKPNGAQERTFSVNDLNSFFIDTYGVLFERQAVPEMEDLPAQEAFLRVLVKGTKNLYYLKSERVDVPRYFIGNPGSLKGLILVRREKLAGSSTNVSVGNKSFQNELIAYLIACQEIVPKVRKIGNSITSVKRVFREYEKCVSEENFEYFEVVRGIETNLGANLAFFSGTLETSDVHVFDPSSGLSLGVFVERAIGFGNNSLTTVFGLNLRSVSHEGRFTSGSLINEQIRQNTYIQSRLSLRYSPFVDKKVFFQLGGVLGFSISEESKVRAIRSGSGQLIREDGLVGNDFRKQELGFTVGLGYRISDKFSVYIGRDEFAINDGDDRTSLQSSDIGFWHFELNVNLFTF